MVPRNGGDARQLAARSAPHPGTPNCPEPPLGAAPGVQRQQDGHLLLHGSCRHQEGFSGVWGIFGNLPLGSQERGINRKTAGTSLLHSTVCSWSWLCFVEQPCFWSKESGKNGALSAHDADCILSTVPRGLLPAIAARYYLKRDHKV